MRDQKVILTRYEVKSLAMFIGGVQRTFNASGSAYTSRRSPPVTGASPGKVGERVPYLYMLGILFRAELRIHAEHKKQLYTCVNIPSLSINVIIC